MQNRKLPIIVIFAGLILVVIVAVWVVQTNQSGQQRAAQPVSESESGIPYPEIERISVEQAYAAYNKGEAVFLDVRNTDSYQSAHIAGAVSIPLGD